MAKKLGRYFRLAIGNGASPEVFTIIAGQRSLGFDASPNFFDTSSKDDYPYATQGVGRQTLNINVEGVLDLPDANGIEAVEAAAEAGTATNFRILDTEPSPDGVMFEGSMYCTFQWDADDEAPGTYTIALTPAAAPTTALDLTPP